MGTVLLDQVIKTDYGQFDLGWNLPFGFDGHFDRFFAGQVNGLVGAADASGVYLHFARRYGGSRVRIELVAQAPDPEFETWEDVVEVSVVIPEGLSLGGHRGLVTTRGPCSSLPGPIACG